MPDWLLLCAQAALAITTLHHFRLRVVPGIIAHQADRAMFTDIWIPLMLGGPLLFFAGLVGNDVRGAGWASLFGPPIIAIMAVGVGLSASGLRPVRVDTDIAWLKPGAAAACLGTAALLVLLAWANDLTLWMGQCAFAIGAAVMWSSSPATTRGRHGDGGAGDERAGMGMVIALACAMGQGVAAMQVSGHASMVSAAMILATAGLALAFAAAAAGPGVAVTIGAWTAAYGLLLGLGIVCMARLVPVAIHVLRGGDVPNLHRMARGFSALSLEAMLLLAIMPAALVAHRLSPTARTVMGGLLLIGAAVLGAWRLAHAAA